MNLSVEGDVKAITKDLDKIQRKLVPAVASSALNATATHLRNESITSAARGTGLPTKHIRWRHDSKGKKTDKRRIYVKKTDKAKAKKLWTYLTVYRRDIAWTVLGAKDSRKYVKGRRGPKGSGVRVRSGGYHDSKAFIAPGKSGGQQAFFRVGENRNPIQTKKAKVGFKIAAITKRVVQRRGSKYFGGIFVTKLNAKLHKKGLL